MTDQTKSEEKKEDKKETEIPTDEKGVPQVAGSEKKESDDPLLKELDEELKEKVGNEIYVEYKDYPLRERVKMLRSLLKGIEKAQKIKPNTDKTEPAKAPAVPPAPSKQKPKTLLEINDKETYFDKLQNKTSLANLSQKWLK